MLAQGGLLPNTAPVFRQLLVKGCKTMKTEIGTKFFICVDFDGTVVMHECPAIGRDLGAENILKRLAQKGHYLILWTMRSGKEL